jgi:hypothetical protein
LGRVHKNPLKVSRNPSPVSIPTGFTTTAGGTPGMSVYLNKSKTIGTLKQELQGPGLHRRHDFNKADFSVVPVPEFFVLLQNREKIALFFDAKKILIG